MPIQVVRFSGQSPPQQDALCALRLFQYWLHEGARRAVNTTAVPKPNDSNKLRFWLMAMSLLFILTSGCAGLRLPAIDPTGSRLFAPLPTTTSIALPGSAGEAGGLLGRLRNLSIPRVRFPQPAFTQPAEPPICPVPATPITAPATIAAGASDEPYVPSANCNGQCKDGPPAVLLGKEAEVRDLLRLPTRGKRGCILLSPQRIVAPVGGEVILLSGICGTDGYLQMGEPLEWMLTPDSVGTLIQVGDDDPGFAHRLARIKKSEKKDGSFAHGVTSTKRTLITRGNLNPADDVQLEKGQTWISLSSPSEGASRVTVLAPDSECWDNRKATATIYWVDARWQFPTPQSLTAGQNAVVRTRVTRSENGVPARGWKVRYEIMQPELASFAGTAGSSVVEVNVDDSGNAEAQLVPVPGTAGTAAVNVNVIRPGGESDNLPDLPIAQGQAFITWSAPQLALRARAPQVASFGVPARVAVTVSNPGNQPATNVNVGVQIPPGVKAVSPDSFAQNLPSTVTWTIGTIPPKTELDLYLDVTAEATTELNFQGRGEGGLVAQDSVRMDVFRPSLVMRVQPIDEQHETGKPVTFNIDIQNTGDRPIEEMELVATGDQSMIHQDTGKQLVNMTKQTGPLQPGDHWRAKAIFVPTDAGRRCVRFEAKGSGEQRSALESCVIVINPVPETPAVNLKITGSELVTVGEKPVFRGTVTNTGKVTLTDVRVTLTYEPPMVPLRRTQDGLIEERAGQYLFAWNVPMLEPGKAELFEVEFQPGQPNPRSQIIMTTRSSEGATAEDTFAFEIRANASNPPPSKAGPGAAPRPLPAPPNAAPLPTLPPVRPTPEIPGSIPIPIPAPSPSGVGSGVGGTPPPPTPLPSGNANNVPDQLQVTLNARDNPVLVGQPIRYTMQVINGSTASDSDVQLRFKLPPGVSVKRVSQTSAPESREIRDLAGVIALPDIRFMRPGESVDYDIVLESNQPQTYVLDVQAISRNRPTGISAKAETTVIAP